MGLYWGPNTIQMKGKSAFAENGYRIYMKTSTKLPSCRLRPYLGVTRAPNLVHNLGCTMIKVRVRVW